MASVGQPAGLDRAELKRMLRVSQGEPVSVAFALHGDKAVIQMDRRKPPRTLERALKDAAPDSKGHRFGTALIDPDDAKHVRFVVNKAGGGLARKLTLALKGTGISRVSIELEDGTAVEQHAGEEDGADAGTGESTASTTPPDGETDTPVADQGASSNPGQAASGAADIGTLRDDLAGLVKQMLAAIARDPSQKAALAQLATDAQASLKRGDAAQASAGIDVLRQALGIPTSADAAPDTASGDNPDGKAAPRLNQASAMKARHVWHGTRQKLDAELAKLHAGIKGHYNGHPGLADIEAATTGSLGAILDTLDTSLADQFDRYANAAPEQQQDIVAEIRATLDKHGAFIAHHPLLQEIDENPFVAVSVRKTLATTLSALRRSID